MTDLVLGTFLLLAFAAQAVALTVTVGEWRESRPTPAGRWGVR